MKNFFDPCDNNVIRKKPIYFSKKIVSFAFFIAALAVVSSLVLYFFDNGGPVVAADPPYSITVSQGSNISKISSSDTLFNMIEISFRADSSASWSKLESSGSFSVSTNAVQIKVNPINRYALYLDDVTSTNGTISADSTYIPSESEPNSKVYLLSTLTMDSTVTFRNIVPKKLNYTLSTGESDPELLSAADIYYYYDAEGGKPETPFAGDGFTLIDGAKKVEDISYGISLLYNTDAVVYVYPKTLYTPSQNFGVTVSNIAVQNTSEDLFKRYILPKVGVNTEVGDIKISGFEKNICTVDFVGEENADSMQKSLVEKADVYVYSYTGEPDYETPFNANGEINDSTIKLSDSQTSIDVNYGCKLRVYVYPKNGYNQSTGNVSFHDGEIVYTGTSISNGSGIRFTLPEVQSDKTFKLSNLNPNNYTITLVGDIECVDTTVPNGFSVNSNTIAVTYNAGLEITMTPKTGYIFHQEGINAYATTSFDLQNKIYAKDGKESLTINLKNINENIEINVSDVQFKLYNVNFLDDNNNPISTDIAQIFIENVASSQNKVKAHYKDKVSFRVKPTVAYDKSNFSLSSSNVSIATVTAGEGEGITGSYDSHPAEDITIKVSGITLNRYNLNFAELVATGDNSLSQKAKDIAHITYCPYNYATGTQDLTASPISFSWGSPVADLIVHGSSFRFTIELESPYAFILDSTAGEIEYRISQASDADLMFGKIIGVKDLIESGSITGASYKCETIPKIDPISKKETKNQQLTVTLKGVNRDLSYNSSASKGNNVNIKDDGFKYSICQVKFNSPTISGEKLDGITLSMLKSNSSILFSDANALQNTTDPIDICKDDDYYFMISVDPEICLFNDKYSFTSSVKSNEDGSSSIPFEGIATPVPAPYWILNEKGTESINWPGNRFSDEKYRVFKVKVPDTYIDVNDNNATKRIDYCEINIQGISPVQKQVWFSELSGVESVTNLQGSTEFEIPDLTTTEPVHVGYNGVLSFVLNPKSGFSFDDPENQIKVLTKSTQTEVNFNYYFSEDGLRIEIPEIQDDLVISITPDLNSIPINFAPADGISYYKLDVIKSESGDVKEASVGDSMRGIYTVSYGNDYYFAIKADTGYNLDSAKIKVGQVYIESLELSNQSYKYFKISGVKSATSVTGTIEKLQLQVSFDSYANHAEPSDSQDVVVSYLQEGTVITGNKLQTLYGESVSFQVELPAQYNHSDFKVEVCDVDVAGAVWEEINSYDGSYTLTDITQNKKIRVSNISRNKYAINLVSNPMAQYVLEAGNGATVDSGAFLAVHGSDYTFKIKAKPGYTLTDKAVVNCKTYRGTAALTPDSSGNYKISQIASDCTVTISDVENIVYKINFQSVDGVSYMNDTGAVISGSININYGRNFEFAVNVEDAYSDSAAGMFIIVNDGKSSGVGAQKLASGRYIIRNVTQDMTINVGNIRKNQYTVTLTKTEGIDYYNAQGRIITGDNQVQHKDSLSFRVSVYAAYKDSKITVMLGDKAMTSDRSGMYTVSGIDENKTVTVLGVEQTEETRLINLINGLPSSIKDLDDVSQVIEATKIYNSLPENKRKTITNIGSLKNLQEQSKIFYHSSNGVSVEGVDWYIKLVAVPISAEAEACSRIYKKLGSEYILSLYDVYLWDMLNDVRYTLPEDKTVLITLPSPDMTYFEKPTGIHEKSDGKVDFLSLKFKNGSTLMETNSFSPMGVIANRSSTPGRSSLLDAVDANVNIIKDYAFANVNSSGETIKEIDLSSNISTDSSSEVQPTVQEESTSGNIEEKFKSRNNKVTAQGSAIRLILVLMVAILIAAALWAIFKSRRKSKSNAETTNIDKS